MRFFVFEKEKKLKAIFQTKTRLYELYFFNFIVVVVVVAKL
jgi:hypothetical protein